MTLQKGGLLIVVGGLMACFAQQAYADDIIVPRAEVMLLPETTVIEQPVTVIERPVIRHKKHWFKRDRDRVSVRLPFVRVDTDDDDDRVIIDSPFFHVDADD